MAAKKRKPAAKRNSNPSALGRSQRVSLQKSQALVQQARAAWTRHQYNQTIKLYEEALRRDPTNFELLVDLARAYGLRYRLPEAEEMLDRALELYPNNAKVRYLIAESYSMINRPTEATQQYAEAVEMAPQHPEATSALVQLSTLYEKGRRKSDAREAIERALTLSPHRPDALFQRARLIAGDGAAEAGMAELQRLVDRKEVPAQTRSDAWYEIGRLQDRAGDFDAAMSAFQTAKELLASQAANFQKEADFLRDRHRTFLEQITPAHFRRWHEAGPASPPRSHALLTGFPRSGTSLLEQVLDGHSQLVGADEYITIGEFVFRPISLQFPKNIPTPDGLDDIPAESLAALRRQYWEKMESLLDVTVGERMLLDKNPSVSYLLPVICRVFPEIKILLALRDPRDVVVSCYMQRLPMNAVSQNYLTLSGTAAKYADAMHYWLTIRSMLANAWRQIRYEDVVADLPWQARQTLEFLGLPWEERVVDFHTHAQSKRVRSPTFQEVAQPIYSHAVGRWRNYAKYMEPVLETLEPYLKEFGYE